MQAAISVNNTITTQLSPQCSIENNILFLSNVHSLCIGGMIIVFHRRSYSRDGDPSNIPFLDWTNCEIDV